MSSKVERGRTLARSQALQILFQAEVRDLSVEDLIAGDYLVSKDPVDPYALELALGAHKNIDRIDYALFSVSKRWSLYRMPATDRNILRLAVFEMRLLDAAIDDAVVINEAVELAKAYGTDESSRFVNGLLGRISKMSELPVPPEDSEFATGDADEASNVEELECLMSPVVDDDADFVDDVVVPTVDIASDEGDEGDEGDDVEERSE